MKDPNWHKCILRADSRDVIKRIPDSSIDLILTDPPYNLGQHSTGNIPLEGRSALNNDVADWDMVDFHPEEWADEFIRILKPTGNIFIFTSYHQIGRWYNCFDRKFDTTNFMVWHKTNPAPKVFKAGFLNSCELILTCWNKEHTWNFLSQSEMHNFIQSPICMPPERLKNPKHPTQKPISILKKMIEIASNEGDIVFDPFMGVGSVGVAALELDRRYIGVEIDETYFEASKIRINQTLKDRHILNIPGKSEEVDTPNISHASEALSKYRADYFNLYNFFKMPVSVEADSNKTLTGLQPILKWPGGKEKELKYILPNLPVFQRYIEPFVGGGAVFMAVRSKEYLINDYSSELIELYKNIANADEYFFRQVELIDKSWKDSSNFLENNPVLLELYKRYKKGEWDKEELRQQLHDFCIENKTDIDNLLRLPLPSTPSSITKEMEVNLHRKMVRMCELEIKKHALPQKDIYGNIETAIKSAIYMTYRSLYNDKTIITENPKLHCALFFFIRNYAYSGMFRYSSRGLFNVPYGGMAYNTKLLTKKLDYYRSRPLLEHFERTQISNLDFEEFLRTINPKENDFVFLDPPYDSEFSTYANQSFTKKDQERLANYMLNECRAKWMLVIKNTDFILGLYKNKQGIKIMAFDKQYKVSFMNRNNKKVTHLLITNY